MGALIARFLPNLGGMLNPWVLLLIVSALAGGGVYCYTWGAQAAEDRIAAASAKAQAAEWQAFNRALAVGARAQRELNDAQGARDDWKRKWNQARRNSQRAGERLAVCSRDAAAIRSAGEAPATGSSPGAAAQRQDDGDAGAVRFSWRFVWLWDGVHTADDGKPLFSDTARLVEKGDATGAAEASPVTVDDVLTNHQVNADLANACRAQLDKLVDAISGLSAAWEADHKGK